ncbi:Gluconate 2-dehydrogenase subunit 3 [Spirosomataceae bacterium TFI 002]|nr:Gluconate 2-dehydrogenase subunit 3 [Spirosomataceae bacterium TFI 002]
MERRKAIQKLGLGFGALLSLPSWANSWNQDKFAFEGNSILEGLVEAIIPEGDQPGAKSIGAHLFVERMVKDCYDENTNAIFFDNLTKVSLMAEELKNKKIEATSLQERIDILRLFEDSILKEDSSFYDLLKRLTIQAYTNSEFYLTKYRDYEMAPGFFHGCVVI